MAQQQISKEAYQKLANKSFDIAESIVQKWISRFAGKPHNEIFPNPVVSDEPMYIHPCNETKNKYVEFKFKLVKQDHKHNIGKLLNE